MKENKLMTIDIVLENGKNVHLIGGPHETLVVSDRIDCGSYAMNADELYVTLKRAWAIVGAYPVRHVTKWYGKDVPTWGEDGPFNNLTVTLKSMIYEPRQRHDGSETIWLLELNRRPEFLHHEWETGDADMADNYLSFHDILCDGLFEYGFTWSSYPRPGEMFSSIHINSNPWSRRVLVRRTTMRDV